MSLISYFVAAFHLGIIVAIPPGAVTIIGIQYALQQRFTRTLLFIIGSTCADLLYLTLAYSGFELLSILHPVVITGFYFFCSLLLIYVALRTLLSKQSQQQSSVKPAGKRSSFLTGIGVTLVNPVTIAGWFAIAGNFFLLAREKWVVSRSIELVALLVIQLGVLCYFIPLMYVISRLKRRLPVTVERMLMLVSSLLLIVLGAGVLMLGIKRAADL